MDNSSLDLCETEFGPDFEIPHIDTDIIHNGDYIFPEKYFAPIELGEQYNFAKMFKCIFTHLMFNSFKTKIFKILSVTYHSFYHNYSKNHKQKQLKIQKKQQNY